MHEKLEKKSKKIEPMKVESAKGKLQIKEKVWLKVSFGPYTAKMPFSIIDDSNYQSSLIIIGSDFLKQTDCTIKLAQKSMWIEDKYHVRLYTDKEKMTQKLEQIKSTLTSQTAKNGENKKARQKSQTRQQKNGALHEAGLNPNERIERGKKRRPIKTKRGKPQPLQENSSILILQRVERRKSEENNRINKQTNKQTNKKITRVK